MPHTRRWPTEPTPRVDSYAVFRSAAGWCCRIQPHFQRERDGMTARIDPMARLEDDLQRTYIPHLRSQFDRARPILLTGAGFSADARNVTGESVPTSQGMRERLWDLCFPGDAFEMESTLADLFEHAVKRHRSALGTLLTSLLSVDASSLPKWYGDIFSFPWFRCYTLNVDDLAGAVGRAFSVPREVREISATNGRAQALGSEGAEALEIIHLNGTIDDIPDHVTFSVTQFADRLAKFDPWYTRFVAELMSHPVVVIGSRLDEPPLWQHLEYRGARGGRQLGELRPRSYLVTPKLARARRALLAELNVYWIPMTGAEFSERVLSRATDARDRGLSLLKTGSREDSRARVPDVAELAVNPTQATDFLLGHEPTWSDLQSGRAIGRESDAELRSGVAAARQSGRSNLVVVTGTAGSGKSTALMRTCLRLSAEGARVGWVDRDSGVSARDIRRAVREAEAPMVLAIDDADIYGSALASIVKDLAASRKDVVILVGLRAAKIDRALNPSVMRDIPRHEFSMPPLTDGDIDELLQVLRDHHRLGALKGMSFSEQRNVLRGQCGRQLLVAMIQATSGRKFEEKAIQELTDLGGEGAKIYALVAVAHALRFPLRREEILLALEGGSNEALNLIRQLVDRHVLTSRGDGPIQARHRVIAEVLHDELQKQGQIAGVLTGLAFVAASQVHSGLRRSARAWRMLRHVINHDYLLRQIGLEKTRNLYGTLEAMLEWDFHYWLQRGSGEVEEGNLNLARMYLSHAHSMAPDDAFVETEWAYLMFREAIANPGAAEAQRSVDEATEILEDLIDRHRRSDSYPYHVLGSQGLAWARRGMRNSQGKGQYLEKLLRLVRAGMREHPTEQALRQLEEDINRDYLGIAVSR